MRVPDNHKIRVFLADDNLIVREGVRALLATAPDIEVIGVAGSYQELVDGAEKAAPQVLVTDIRMPPSFQREGIEAAKEVRKRHPGTGIVVLSQYDEPDYAIALLSEGAAGYAYLLKDRVAEGDQLFRAIREVTTGGSMLDPRIVEALLRRAAAAEVAASGHRRPRGAGRKLEPAATHGNRGEAAPRRPQAGGDRNPDRHGANVRHPRLLVDRRRCQPDGAGSPAERAPRGDESRHPGERGDGDAVRR